MKISFTILCLLGVVLADDSIQKANKEEAERMTGNMNQMTSLLQGEMNSFRKVTPETWANKMYYNNETPVTPAQVCMVKKVVNQCFQEQVDLALKNLRSSDSFDILLTKVVFDTGNPKGKQQKDNVGRLLQSVSNPGHGLTKNLIGWLKKSHNPGKGQRNACSTRALGFGNYAHTSYKGAYNVAFDTTRQLRIANGKMAALLNQDYTESNCLEQVVKGCNKYAASKKEQMMTLHKAILLNLDTELDYYHSDGKTDFKGNRNTRTYIKDVSMGAGSSTNFGLMNLDQVTVYMITAGFCKQSTLDSKYASYAKKFLRLKDGTCADNGCTIPDGSSETTTVPAIGDITAEKFKCGKQTLINLDSVYVLSTETVLQNLKFESKKQKRCERLEQKSEIPTFWGKTEHDIAFRYAVQTEIDQLGCY